MEGIILIWSDLFHGIFGARFTDIFEYFGAAGAS